MSPLKLLTFSACAALVLGCTEVPSSDSTTASLDAENTSGQSSEKPTNDAAQKPIKPEDVADMDPDKEAAMANKLIGQAPAGTYELDKGHGYIAFTYDHSGYSKPQLRWGNWDSTLEWNPMDPEGSSVSVTIEVDSVDSGVAKFDDHLRSADFFEAETYPTITFQSTELKRTGGMTGTITGDLTIKDMTKPITLDVTFNKAGEARGGGHKVGFSATTSMLRSEWGVGAYVPFVGDEVDLIIEVEYETPAAE